MNSKETIINATSDFLGSNSPSRVIRWVMALFLLFCGIPQKTVASITNYTDRQVRNIRDRFENSYGDFLWEGGKRGRKKKIKKRMFGADSEVYRGSSLLYTQRHSGVSQNSEIYCILQKKSITEKRFSNEVLIKLMGVKK